MKKVLALSLVLMLTGCSSLTAPVSDDISDLKDVIVNNDKVIQDELQSLRNEITGSAEVVEVEVVTEISTYDVCYVDGGETLENAQVTDKAFSTVITIEYDGDYGRETKPFDTSKTVVKCETTFGE